MATRSITTDCTTTGSRGGNGGSEIRCYMRDPDGYLIEVGQLVGRPDSS